MTEISLMVPFTPRWRDLCNRSAQADDLTARQWYSRTLEDAARMDASPYLDKIRTYANFGRERVNQLVWMDQIQFANLKALAENNGFKLAGLARAILVSVAERDQSEMPPSAQQQADVIPVTRVIAVLPRLAIDAERARLKRIKPAHGYLFELTSLVNRLSFNLEPRAGDNDADVAMRAAQTKRWKATLREAFARSSTLSERGASIDQFDVELSVDVSARDIRWTCDRLKVTSGPEVLLRALAMLILEGRAGELLK